MSIFSEDELVAPSWINQEFFEKVLQQYENNDNIQIAHFDISPASKKGDHYASVIFRCKVLYSCPKSSKNKEISLILKTLPTEDGPKRDLLTQSNIFETEIDMYTKALPRIQKTLAECGEHTKLAAEIVYHSLEPHKVIIFEDLCKAGYDTIRGRYLTDDELKIVYCKLAKLHAASFVLSSSEEREYVTNYEKGLFCNSSIMDLGLISHGIVNFMDMLSKDEELKVFLEKVKAMQPEMMDRCRRLYMAYKLNNNSNDIFVLNHGDFHIKNLMFKSNTENQIEDVVMVDYQISCFAPSTVDLSYSQYLLMSPECRLRRNEFMYFYFEEFIRMLKKMKFEGKLPKYSDFQIAALKYRHVALFLLSTFLPHVGVFLVASDDELKDVDTTKYVEDVEMGSKSYQREEFIDEMRRFLPLLLMEGFLD